LTARNDSHQGRHSSKYLIRLTLLAIMHELLREFNKFCGSW
jgi:hypothetical protein